MLKMTDLTATKELTGKTLDHNAMARVRGGFDPFTIDGSTTLKNKVADVDQLFEFAFTQANAGDVTNNQAIKGGNGITYAPVDQKLYQDNAMWVYDIGNTSVS